MRVKIAGMVQSVIPAVWDGKPVTSKQGVPCSEVYVLQNGAGRMPELVKVRVYTKTPPKQGETKEFEASVDAWHSKPSPQNPHGKVGVSVVVFES